MKRIKSESPATVEQRLRAAALAQITDVGVAGLTARKIATVAGRTTMCIYSHFGSTGALLRNLYGDLAVRLCAATRDAETPAVGLSAWARTHPGGFRLAFHYDLEPLGIQPAERARLLAALVEIFGGFTSLGTTLGMISIELAADSHLVPPADADSWQSFTDAQII